MAISWSECLNVLKHDLDAEQFNMWLKPLKSHFDGETLFLFAANKFVLDWVKDEYFLVISNALKSLYGNDAPHVSIKMGDTPLSTNQYRSSQPKNIHSSGIDNSKGSYVTNNNRKAQNSEVSQLSDPHTTNRLAENPKLVINSKVTQSPVGSQSLTDTISDYPNLDDERGSISSEELGVLPVNIPVGHNSNVNPKYTFDNFVEGKSNQLARAAATQVAQNPGVTYNPLFFYGGTGLGKTHLIHAIGNEIIRQNPSARIVYMHSERFVQDMVKALQNNAIEDFKRFYRSVDALLIDDIQLFAGKDRSQEEFFHTFNSLLEGNRQIIATSDKFPKEIENVEERLISRLGWGLTVMIEPPELETRVAILLSKAKLNKIDLPHEVAFFLAKKLRSNVRDLEGALNRVIANAKFTGKAITIEFVKDTLHDLLALQDKLVTIDNIIKTVAEYYKIKVADIHSKRRTRSIARPRQVAMALAKELTNNSYPEIGNSFGGRDHTTVIHAVRKMDELRGIDQDIMEDYKNLTRILSS